MSDVLPRTPAALGVADRAATAAAVTLARILAHAAPDTTRRILTAASRGARSATYEDARLARDAVLTVSAFCRGGSSCLPRSLATALVCRTRGTWPDWCVGVLTAPPFTAHAWIEADGRIVDEPMDVDDFATFFRVRAGRDERDTVRDHPAVPKASTRAA